GWSERTWVRRCGLRVTSLADAVIDFAAELPTDQIRQILEHLLWRRLSPYDLQAGCARVGPGRRPPGAR
ncbi:MAG: hypothetical protein ABJA34_12370, partial [Pseudonocardiales bacterium]